MSEGADTTSESKRKAHMQRRRGHGLSFSKLGSEFGVSKSTAHRKARESKPKAKMNLRKGIIEMGSAK